MKSRRSKVPLVISPLGLLLLSACGGGSGGGGYESSGGADKGPLFNALAFLDYDDDGEFDPLTEPSVRTDELGNFVLSGSAGNENASIIILTDETTIDTSSGSILAGFKMSAPAGTKAVSI
ncbi:MAG: hypothetical protein ACKVKR_01520, partial [Pseudomonadales bacterium]